MYHVVARSTEGGTLLMFREGIRPAAMCGLVMIVTLLTSLANGDEDSFLKDARKRIRQHRMSDVRVVVVDQDGKHVPSAKVAVQQTSHDFLFGCNLFMWGRVGSDSDEQLYRQRFADLFNFATLPFYWWSYERVRGQPDHDRTEQIARWCRENQITTKGHPLAWNYVDPRWLPEGLDEVRTLQMARIDDCVSRFTGLIDRWDVVNEATHFERQSFREKSPKLTNMWEEAGRMEFTRECFQHARRANPEATLLINDYRVDPEYEVVIEKLVDEQGKPLYDVIGIQSHMHRGTWKSERVWEVCKRFAKFGVPLHFTETTILSGERGWERSRRGGNWETTEEGERWQADEVERIYTMVFSHPAVEALTWWDFSDRNAWQRAPAGFLRKDMSPKPAYERLLGLIKGKWWTQASGQTDAQGAFTFRGFRGGYHLAVKTTDGRTAEFDLSVEKGQPREFVVKLAAREG
jgi:GH35 family endo-1,4-beta-xylanase